MEPDRFDRLTRLLATGGSRRALLTRLAGGALGTALAGRAATAEARGRPLVTGPEECGACVVFHLIACENGTCRAQCASGQLPNFDCDDCVNACVVAACRASCGVG